MRPIRAGAVATSVAAALVLLPGTAAADVTVAASRAGGGCAGRHDHVPGDQRRPRRPHKNRAASGDGIRQGSALGASRTHPGRMPIRPTYSIRPGDRIEVEVVQPDGGRALVAGTLDAVPETETGGRTRRIRVCDARATVLPATS